MSNDPVRFTVFAKPWPALAPSELAAHVKALGFAGVELPVRPGFAVEPATVERRLPDAARAFRDLDVCVASVASEPDDAVIAACGAAGVPLLRICVDVPEGVDYLTAIEQRQRGWDRLVPRLEEHGVTLGIQNHCGRCLTHAMHLHHALGRYDRRHVAAVWDPAHNALQGENVDLALDVIWSHLALVNLKNAYWQRANGPEAEAARWRTYWTDGRHGLCSWPAVAAELQRRGYRGDVCLSAEYSDHEAVDRLIAQDIAFARQCFAGAAS